MTMALWTAREIAKIVQGQCLSDFDITGLCIDTREVQKGDLFVALQGERDGHDYVQAALENGAAGALVRYVPDGMDPQKLIVVENTLLALNALGQTARHRTAAKIVAVTGSAGKTGTKEQLRTLFSSVGAATHAAVRSFNNHIGVPLTLARMPQDTQYGVFEIGMNHPGEIAPLSKLCTPDVALITTVAPVHLAAFDDVSDIAREKASIFAGLVAGGTAVIPRDSQYYDVLCEEAKRYGVSSILTFGTHKSCDAELQSCTLHVNKTVATARIFGQDISYELGGLGQHLALNALGALVAAQACGIDLVQAALALADWRPPSGRGDRWRVSLSHDKHFTLIDDSYNANPASMAASLDILAHTSHDAEGRRIAILTDMLELGEQEVALHRDLADLPAIQGIDQFHAAGYRMKALYDALPEEKRGLYRTTADALTKDLAASVCAYDIVLVKGSNGSKASHIVNYLKTLGTIESLFTPPEPIPEGAL